MWIRDTETQQAEQNNFPRSNSLYPNPSYNLIIPRGSGLECGCSVTLVATSSWVAVKRA